MLVVDSQVHMWGANTPERPWPKPGEGGRNPKAHRDVPLGKEELLAEMDKAGVTAVIIVPPSWEGERNDLALAAARLHPGRFAVMGRVVPDEPDGPAAIANWKAQPGMLGVRLVFGDDSPWPDAGVDHWLWPSAESSGVPITLALRSHFGLVKEIAERHPRLRLSLDHMGTDWSKKDAEAFAHLDQVLRLAAYPNVAVKVSMLPSLSTDPYPYRNVHRYLREVYDAYGPRRMFWGTNLSRLPCSYRQAVTMFTEEIPWLSAADLDWIMGRAICDWLGWTLPR